MLESMRNGESGREGGEDTGLLYNSRNILQFRLTSCRRVKTLGPLSSRWLDIRENVGMHDLCSISLLFGLRATDR